MLNEGESGGRGSCTGQPGTAVARSGRKEHDAEADDKEAPA
jgi:hypothetical protein